MGSPNIYSGRVRPPSGPPQCFSAKKCSPRIAEETEHRLFAKEDPRGFLARYRNPVILDEVQRVPDLFSYIQSAVDEDDTPGRFIPTGSHNFLLVGNISQTLAGRVGQLLSYSNLAADCGISVDTARRRFPSSLGNSLLGYSWEPNCRKEPFSRL